MKTITLFLIGYLNSMSLFSQNVGIGMPLPTEKLQVDSGHIKVGSAVWSSSANDRFLKFGDADYVMIGEANTDDWMELHARKFTFVRSAGTVSPLVEINGDVKIIDGFQGPGKVLTSDAVGKANWLPLAIPASTASFRATKTSNQIAFSGASTTMNWPGLDYNAGSNFGSDQFNVPVTGVYHFDIKLLWTLVSVGSFKYYVIVSLNSGFSAFEISRSQYSIDGSNSINMTSDLSLDVKLTAGQYVYIQAYQNSGVDQNVLASYSSFSGHRVY